METIQDELNTTEEKTGILNMKHGERFFLKYPSLRMCAPENYREVSEHVGKHVDVCSHLLSFGILPLVAACQGLLMWKLSFVTEVLNFYYPNCIQPGGNLIIPLKILLRLPIRRR